MDRRAFFKEQSAFCKQHLNRPVVTMLQEHGFFVQETENDVEDMVHFEDHKTFVKDQLGLSANTLVFNVKREFVGEYPLSAITSIFVEGRYKRKLTGEKMYTAYYYSFYKRGFLKDGRFVNERFYAKEVDKLTLIKIFEEEQLLFQSKGEMAH